MKIVAFCLLLCLIAVSGIQAQEALNNDSIIKMVKAGLGEDVILNVVNSQPGKYSVSPDDLIALKNAGVASRVIDAMVNKSVAGGPAPLAPPAEHATTPAPLAPAPSPPVDIRSVHKVFIEKMPNDLDQYLRAEFNKQLKDKVIVVLKKEEADGIITGINEEQKGTGAKITGRYLGLHDTVNGTISLLDRTESSILWSDEAGDRNLFFGIVHRGGERKVADRLVSKLKKAMGY